MTTCSVCHQPSSKEYYFYYGKKKSAFNQTIGYHVTRTTMNIEFNATPFGIPICDQCVEKSLSRNNSLVYFRNTIIFGLLAVAVAILGIDYSITETVSGISVILAIACIGLMVYLSNKLPTGKIENPNLIGEKLAIKAEKANLEAKGYDYFIESTEYHRIFG